MQPLQRHLHSSQTDIPLGPLQAQSPPAAIKRAQKSAYRHFTGKPAPDSPTAAAWSSGAELQGVQLVDNTKAYAYKTKAEERCASCPNVFETILLEVQAEQKAQGQKLEAQRDEIVALRQEQDFDRMARSKQFGPVILRSIMDKYLVELTTNTTTCTPSPSPLTKAGLPTPTPSSSRKHSLEGSPASSPTQSAHKKARKTKKAKGASKGKGVDVIQDDGHSGDTPVTANTPQQSNRRGPALETLRGMARPTSTSLLGLPQNSRKSRSLIALEQGLHPTADRRPEEVWMAFQTLIAKGHTSAHPGFSRQQVFYTVQYLLAADELNLAEKEVLRHAAEFVLECSLAVFPHQSTELRSSIVQTEQLMPTEDDEDLSSTTFYQAAANLGNTLWRLRDEGSEGDSETLAVERN